MKKTIGREVMGRKMMVGDMEVVGKIFMGVKVTWEKMVKKRNGKEAVSKETMGGEANGTKETHGLTTQTAVCPLKWKGEEGVLGETKKKKKRKSHGKKIGGERNGGKRIQGEIITMSVD